MTDRLVCSHAQFEQQHPSDREYAEDVERARLAAECSARLTSPGRRCSFAATCVAGKLVVAGSVGPQQRPRLTSRRRFDPRSQDHRQARPRLLARDSKRGTADLSLHRMRRPRPLGRRLALVRRLHQRSTPDSLPAVRRSASARGHQTMRVHEVKGTGEGVECHPVPRPVLEGMRAGGAAGAWQRQLQAEDVT